MPGTFRFGRCEVRSVERQLFVGGKPASPGAREQSLQRLAAHLRLDEIEQWQRAGAPLSVEDAYRLALADARD